MAARIKYVLCLIGLVFAICTPVIAQYSEEDLIEEADDLFEEGYYAEAMPLYAQLLSLNPTNPVFNYKYGATALYGDAEKKAEAPKYLSFAAGKPMVDERCWYFLGRAYHLNYLFQDAIAAYEKYISLASSGEVNKYGVEHKIEMARNGQNLLANIKEIKVLDRKKSPESSFFRVYDLADIGGKILVTPEELLSSEDKKRNHRSLIHFRGTGTTVYFSSYGKGGKNGLDIYQAEVLPDGTFSEPKPIQGPVNTPYDENYPFLHPDNGTFYFSSTGHSSMGGYDVFKASFDRKTGTFGNPENLDFAINTPDDDLFYLADSLNRLAHFASARSSKQGELFVYKVLVETAPLEVAFIKGTFVNKVSESQKLAKITVVNAATNEEVDVQYTDPTTGDYVLSFSKGGRYKFLVEVKNSDKVHAGLVDVPSGKGARAYLQEMDLISSAGVEKLLINNLFDQTYEGDVMALAQKLLRQRAALNVNFDPEKEALPPIDKDPELAYSDAGFGAGMSNETVLEEAEARVEELMDRKVLAAKLAVGAAETSDELYAIAGEETEKADSLLALAGSASEVDKDKYMYLAGLAQLKARNALRRARNAEFLMQGLIELEETSDTVYLAEKQRVDSLREAIDSGDYDRIYAGLLEEKEMRSNRDLVEDRFEPINDFRRKGLSAENEAQNMLDRARKLREEEERLQGGLLTRRRQAEKLKGKEKKAAESEIAVLENDLADLKERTRRAFKQAEDAQVLAYDEMQRYDILVGINEDEDLPTLAAEGETRVHWTPDAASVMDDEIEGLAIDEQRVQAYIASHPEELSTLETEGLAMQFRSTFLASEGEEPLAAASESAVEGDGEKQADLDESEATGEVAETSRPAEADDQDVADYSADFDPSLSMESRIEAEQLKINAALDWIQIIDESIGQLREGVGGDGAEEQLAQYEALKAKKLAEIEQREANITDWRSELAGMDSEVILGRAMADVDTLSPSYVARLESKIDDYSSDNSTKKRVSQIDRDYLPALTEIELSGLSAPEIAMKRIELNQQLISDLNSILEEGISSDVSEEEVLEMRRIKALEIKQDQAIVEGSMAYAPRTVEAREYLELITEDTPDERPEQEEDFTGLSPAIAGSLQQDFSRELIMPGYEERMAVIENRTDPNSTKERIDIREDYLARLESEITLFKAAMESSDNPDERLLQRYNEMLTERSAVVDELDADHSAIKAMEAEATLASLTTETESLKESYESGKDPDLTGEDVEGMRREVSRADSTLDVINREMETLVSLLDDPEAEVDRDRVQEEIQDLDTFQQEVVADREEILALLNRAEIASVAAERERTSSIESISENLIAEFDRARLKLPEADPEKNLSQLAGLNASFSTRIQEVIDSLETTDKSMLTDAEVALIATELSELESMAADKQQEADRLRTEAEMQAFDRSVDDEAPGADEGELTSQTKAIPEDTPDLSELQYRSLNASIIKNELKVKADSIALLSEQLDRAKSGEFGANSQTEMAELQSEIDRLSGEMYEGIRLSNVAEIEYLRSENERLLTASDPERSVHREELVTLQSENNALLQRGDFGNLSRTDQERLIEELAEINEALGNLVSPPTPVAAESSTQISEGLMDPESHQLASGKTYVTEMQLEVANEMSSEEIAEVMAQDEILSMNFDFAEKEDIETKRDLVMSATKVDEIGWDLLQETPLQMNYLVGSIRADSLKRLEKKSADHARTLQAQAIERTKEAGRLLNMPKDQSTKKDQKIIEERANKLLSEAEVLYRRSAMAAGQAELLRTRRMEAEKNLSLASEDLTKREIVALNKLLLAPGYNLVSSKPEAETAQTEVEQEVPEPPVTEEETAEAEQPETEKTLPVEEVSPERAPVAGLSEDADLSEVKGTWLSMVEVIAEKSDFSDVEETMFAEAGTSPHSEKDRIPIDPAMPDGLIFQVQVGAYRNPIPQDLFGAYAPLMGQRLDNGIVRYRAGLFKKYKQALQARNEIRDKGYSDAFVVAYVDGERLTGAQARAILQQAREGENIDTGLLAGASEPEAKPQAASPDSPETQPTADYYNDPEAAEAEQVEVIKGLFYTVQVGVYSKPVKLAQLYNLTELNSELTEGGFIRYTTGRFANLNEANTRKVIARDKGVNDAFITAYYNGKRINLEEAEALLQANGSQVLIGAETEEAREEEAPVRTYVVVMGNFAGDVPQELADLFLEKKDWGIRKVEGGGMSMYVSRELESRDEAEKLLEECRRFNIKTAVIGEMVDGKIVSTSVK